MTAYSGTNVSTNYKTGDATYETKGWHGDLANFVSSYEPVFERGGDYSNDSSNAGVFYYGIGNGSNYYDGSFRMCLAVK